MANDDLAVLLVDDDDVSCEAVIRAFKKRKLDVTTVTAFDGYEALEILKGRHETKEINLPFVVLLDLNMPRMNGFELLEAMRKDPDLEQTVVFVISTSDDRKDVHRAYESQIAGYMVKSELGPQFEKLYTLLQNYKDSITFIRE